jgi:hypothetical protein
VKRASLLCLAALVAFVAFSVRTASAAERGVNIVIIVGVNKSVDEGVADLRFADDDAARYFDLFTTLGTEAVLLARLDDNTRRLHARAASLARPPRLAELERAVSFAMGHAAVAKQRRAPVNLYFVYAGHGNVKDGAGYVSLEDSRLTGRELETRVLDKIRPDRAHFIVDACSSYFLAHARGAGGKRRKLQGFSSLGALGTRAEVGVLLSTSSARESHEWERVQAGVFSHEVRSGLYGAADADHDGRISYREIAAFVERANAAIANQRFRPEVYARPPSGSGTLVELGEGLKRRIEVDGGAAAHYVLEDHLGVYLAEFHNAPDERVALVRSAQSGRLYLGRAADGKEYVIEPELETVSTRTLALAEPQKQARGAAHEAFQKTFELPFGETTVRSFRFHVPKDDGVEADAEEGPNTRKIVGFGLLGLGAASSAVGGWVLVSAANARDLPPTASQAEADDRNDEIRSKNVAGGVALGVGAAAFATGMTLLLWPDGDVRLRAAASGYGARLDGAF